MFGRQLPYRGEDHLAVDRLLGCIGDGQLRRRVGDDLRGAGEQPATRR